VTAPVERGTDRVSHDQWTPQSAEFRTRWAAHNLRFHDTGTKDLHHSVVGDITLTYNRLELAADPRADAHDLDR
jgi:hypothetical protein